MSGITVGSNVSEKNINKAECQAISMSKTYCLILKVAVLLMIFAR